MTIDRATEFKMALARTLFLCVINAFLAVCGSVVNILVTVVILEHRELQKGLNLLIVSLTFANLINCLIAQPFYVFYLSKATVSSKRLILAFELIAFVGLHAVLCTLITMTYHRMRALSEPFHYLLQLSRRKMVIWIVSTWITAVMIGVVVVPSMPGEAWEAYVHTAMMIFLMLTYVRILYVCRRKRKQIAEQAGSVNYQQQVATIQQESAATLTSAILVGTTLLCFLPDVLLDLVNPKEAQNERRIGTYTLLFSCSTISPCIVLWRSQQLKRAILDKINLSR